MASGSESRETSQEAAAITQVREDSDWDQSDGSESDERQVWVHYEERVEPISGSSFM